MPKKYLFGGLYYFPYFVSVTINQYKMNQVLKIIGGFFVGILIGLVAAGAGLVLFGDMSFSEYIGKFSQLNVIEVIGIPLLSLAFS